MRTTSCVSSVRVTSNTAATLSIISQLLSRVTKIWNSLINGAHPKWHELGRVFFESVSLCSYIPSPGIWPKCSRTGRIGRGAAMKCDTSSGGASLFDQNVKCPDNCQSRGAVPGAETSPNVVEPSPQPALGPPQIILFRKLEQSAWTRSAIFS